ncbi:hypothetical protein G9E11_10805 [Arthrobacter sp. IA7]|uniref:hypothetical protein n=1 Tax=Arthrobacter ipis TaxID=2716202 RepID=UPI00168474C5|nr:hypothetical protein [Arthrobacter ipis]MBD1542733.1 hypothetical protein [Arthrobacter ipis]
MVQGYPFAEGARKTVDVPGRPRVLAGKCDQDTANCPASQAFAQKYGSGQRYECRVERIVERVIGVLL